MSDDRPDPDELLERVTAAERRDKRGKLTVFFGMAPGVGKTFQMLLEASHQRDVEGRDVVVGIVETHGRFETTTMLAGYEQLPRRKVPYRGASLDEFDLDAALARKPSLLLVDELAHTNAEGSRHPKRWQDIDELLAAGIEVMTTLNVQHLESVNDIVAQITGVTVRETVPDSVIDQADEVKLVDLPPDELLERLREGKVYLPAQAERAIENFFKKGNLIALRELALRKTAERVDAEMQAWRRAHGIEKIWAARDRMLVCISPSPFSANLLRVGRRIASGLRAAWYAVYVETPVTMRLPAGDRARLSENLRLAERLGAETVTLTGDDAAQAILAFAREQNVTKIVAGKPRARGLRGRLRTSFLDELILGSRDIDIYVTAGMEDATGERPAASAVAVQAPAPPAGADGYVVSALVASIVTLVSWLLFGRDQLADVAMSYVLGIVLVSMRFGFRASLATVLASVLAFDFFFVPPYFTFSVSDLRHIVTFAVMLVVGVVIAGLTQRVKDQALVARTSERRTALLFAMSRDLAHAPTQIDMIRAASRHLEDVFDARVTVFVRAGDDDPRCSYATPGFEPPVDKELGVVRWTWSNRREAGAGTDTVPGATGLYLPLATSAPERRVLGVLGLFPSDAMRLADPEQRRLADALAGQLASAMERVELAEEGQRARLKMEAEQLRSTLLSSVSHDLRTPLAVMKGAASTLSVDHAALAPDAHRELCETLLDEIDHLERLVRNLLDMTRIESGAVELHRQWHSLEETVGGALDRVEARLAGHEVTTDVPGDLLASFDEVLIEQLLVNLLENAAKHTAPGTPIEVRAERNDGGVTVEVADRGPGIPPGDEERVFEKFHRGRAEGGAAGVGLGLAICRAIATAHGGRIWAENRPRGGASFKVALPSQGEPPKIEPPEVGEDSERAGEVAAKMNAHEERA